MLILPKYWSIVKCIPRASIKYFLKSVSQFSPSVVSDSLHPMDCSTPGLPVHHQLPKFTQTHLHWVGDAIQPSHHLSSPALPAFNLSQPQGNSVKKNLFKTLEHDNVHNFKLVIWITQNSFRLFHRLQRMPSGGLPISISDTDLIYVYIHIYIYTHTHTYTYTPLMQNNKTSYCAY